jgi:hypothetical protein
MKRRHVTVQVCALLAAVSVGCRSVKVITEETVRWKTDTVVAVDWRRDTVKITERGDTVKITEVKWRDRYFYSSRSAADTSRAVTIEKGQQAAKEGRRRSRWWLWLAAGAVAGFFIPEAAKAAAKLLTKT